MATYTSNVNRVTGLSTGMDIDSMVDQIMSAESAKYERLQKQQTWLTWQQEAYRDVITKLQNFQSKWFGSDSKTNLRYSSAFNSYAATVTNSSGISTNAIKVNSMSGTAECTVKVQQVAVSESYSSTSPLKKGITTTNTAEDIADTISSDGSISLKFTFDGVTKDISISQSEIDKYKADNSNVTDDAEALAGVLSEKLETAFGKEAYGNNETKVTVSTTADGFLRFDTTDGHTLTIANGSSDSCKKFGITSGESSATTSTTTLGEALGKNFTDMIDSSNSGDDALKLNFNGKTVTLTSDDTVESMIQKINDSDAGFTISFNSLSETFKIESNTSGASNGIEITDQQTKNFLKNCLNIDIDDKSDTNTGYVAGQDAVITINGVTTTRTSNDIEYNGLNFTITEAAIGEQITISAAQDVDSVYDKIVEFVNDYNDLIEELNSLVSETRAKDDTYGYYEPLTDSEKEAMTEDEIKKWEEKAKTGLLYNDSYISSMLSSLRSIMYSSVSTSSGNMAFYTIGITTSSDHTTNGKLIIDEDKLKEAIRTNPEGVTALFTKADTGIADQVNNIINGAIGTKGSLRQKAGIENTSSVNDNILSNQLKELAERIAAEKERLANRESRYYTLFASMETAITQQNSQLESLYQILGS